VNAALGLVPARHERSLVLEALTLLAQSQADLEHAVGDQVAHAAQRVAAVERRCDEFDARLLSIDEHLQRLLLQLEPPPDPDIHDRLAQLQAHVERLSARERRPLVIEAWSRPPAAPNGPAPAPGPVPPAPPPPSRASEPAPTPSPRYRDAAPAPSPHADEPAPAPMSQASEPVARPLPQASEPAPAALSQAREIGQPGAPARALRTTAVAAPPSMWELLGPTPKDRTAIILMAIGLVAVIFAVLLQLRLP
jgi:hypothetical protein